MDEINNLIAIQSAIQLNENYKGLDALIDTISDLKLAQKIINEVKRRNFGNISSIIDTYLFDNNQDNVLYKKNDIKQFDFSYIEKCNTKQIKKSIGVFQLPFYQEKNREGFDTGLYSHWDSLSRFAVLIDKGLAEELKKDPELWLNLTKELLLDELGYYTSFTIEKYHSNTSTANDEDYYESETFEDYNGSYAQDYEGYSDQQIDDIFDGDADLYWNID